MGLVGGGAHAGAVVVHQDETMRIPAGLSFAEAGAIPEAFLTGFDALVFRARLASGDRVLIHAVASGLGTATAQLAHSMGATVLGTSRTPEKLGRLREYGVDMAIDTSVGGFREAVSPPVQVVIDVLGGPALADNLAVLAPRGRLVLLGFLQGPEVATSLAPILRKRLEVIGTIMRARPLEERIPLVQAFVEQVLAGFEGAGGGPPALRPVVDAVYPMERIADAHRAMEGNATFGKLILEW
jgi:NADPH:quinone reductase-like Zn-dependent oxidoreductase